MSYFFESTPNIPTKNAKKYFQRNNSFEKSLLSYIRSIKSIKTTQNYRNVIKKLLFIMKGAKYPPLKLKTYEKELDLIKENIPLSEKTIWGGVTLKKVDVGKDYIQKLLVINAYGLLGFEIHKLKHEKLKILEGVCFVLYSNHAKPKWKKGSITIRLATANDRFDFLPNDEHGIIALTNSVIEEISTNHLADLTYIFPAS